ncbi:MAG: PQQ-dependent sugar dehydrogenase [Nitrospirae bacterium]|nr:PQQ-dependent sugar dehydrogenase [Nitrospirota bacterium]
MLTIGRSTWNSTGQEQTILIWPEITLKLIVSGLKQPTHITHAGDGSKRLFVTEQRGRILLIKGGNVSPRPFLDIADRVSCCGERGLLSIVFPPGYAKRNYFYLNYTDRSGDTVVARYHLTKDPDRADPKSEEIVLTIKQPYSNHNGGQMAFGPDGYLYIGMGDGGSAGDPQNNAQNPASLLGKMLRIDVESGKRPYSIPPDNPFLQNRAYRPEIWAMGLRNPWRFSFDKKTGDLYIADVGQNNYEEIDFEPKGSKGGRNYGWNIMEGLQCYKTENCNRKGLSLPVTVYDHDKGCSVTGGLVYRGSRFPRMQGIYFYGDYCSGRIWGLRHTGEEWMHRELRDSGLSVSTFGEDEAGEVFVADYGKGNIYRIETQ